MLSKVFSLSLSLAEWPSKHLHNMRPTNSIATRNSMVASEKSTHPGRAVSKTEWVTAITDHDICHHLPISTAILTDLANTHRGQHPPCSPLLDGRALFLVKLNPTKKLESKTLKHLSQSNNKSKTSSQPSNEIRFRKG